MRFGSVCSGIEAASVAWEPLGWKAAWFSEIEKFPSEVLKHHYPDTPNLGDMTALPDRILSGEIEAPEIFCGGTPCQAFSVAGLRQSLNDDRGNLSLTFVGIANAIDHVRSVRGDSSAIIFWENVPGVLNTKDNAFGCFIGALAGEIDPVTCPNGKWSTAGVVVGQKRAVAWRVLDAQYFGVAQRRRRVFVVASARADFDPAAVLFEFEGFRRDIAPSREARQSVAPTVGTGAPFSRTGNERIETEAIITMAHGQAGAEIATDRSPTLTCNHEAPIAFHPTQDPISSANVCHSLGANSNATAAVAIGTDCYNGNLTGDIAATMGTPGSSINASGPTVMVPQPISIHPHCIGRAPEAGPQGKEYLLDGSAYCMDSRGQPQAVVQHIGIDIFNAAMTGDVAVPLTHRSDGTGTGPTVMVPIAWDEELNASIDQAGTLLRGGDGGRHDGVMAFNIAPGKGELKDDIHITPGDVTKTLDASGSNPAMHQGGSAVIQVMQVRRLTPVECERLQGFPDNYTNIKDKCPDGPRYKALGNSWAVPVVRWIGKRIQEHINAP